MNQTLFTPGQPLKFYTDCRIFIRGFVLILKIILNMKPGSLVVVLPYEQDMRPCVLSCMIWKWKPEADEKTPYVLEAITQSDSGAVIGILEGGPIGVFMDDTGRVYQMHLGLDYLREIQPPISSEEIAIFLKEEVLEAEDAEYELV